MKRGIISMMINILPGIIILVVIAFFLFILLVAVMNSSLTLFEKKNPEFWEYLNKYHEALEAYNKVKDDAVILTAKVEALQQEHKTLVQQNEILIIQRDHLIQYIDKTESERAEEVTKDG